LTHTVYICAFALAMLCCPKVYVRLSVTIRYCVKTAELVEILLPSDIPQRSSFLRTNRRYKIPTAHSNIGGAWSIEVWAVT